MREKRRLSPEFDLLATYNAERARGLVHTPEWSERMARAQEKFDVEARVSMAEAVEQERKCHLFPVGANEQAEGTTVECARCAIKRTLSGGKFTYHYPNDYKTKTKDSR